MLIKQERLENFKALNNVYILMFDIETFEEILKKYEEITEEVQAIAIEREHERLHRKNVA